MTATLPRALALTTMLFGACASTGAPEVTEGFAQTPDGYLLHTRRVGEGEEVLLVLGASELQADLGPLARGRTVIHYDLRGRGRSDPAGLASLERDIEDLELVRDWFAAEQVVLVGVNYRAAVAAYYAARNPERVSRLVLVSPMPARKFPYWKIYERVYSERRSAAENVALAEMKRDGLHRSDPAAYARAFQDFVLGGMLADERDARRVRGVLFPPPNDNPERALEQHWGLLRSLGDWDFRTALSHVEAPTLVVAGSVDLVPEASTREWVDAIPNARLLRVQGAGRMPWVEEPGAFFDGVEAFLAE